MIQTPETQAKPRNARLEARVSSDQKNLFQRAANLTGRTLSELVIDSTQEAADQIWCPVNRRRRHKPGNQHHRQ